MLLLEEQMVIKNTNEIQLKFAQLNVIAIHSRVSFIFWHEIY